MEYGYCLNEFKKSLLGGSEKEIVFEAINEQISTNNIRWLDIGVGDGKYLKKIFKLLINQGFSIKLTGVDISNDLISCAKKVFPKAKFIDNSFYKTKLEDKYDVIHLGQSFYYLNNKKKELEKILRHLSEGGLLIISLWSKKDDLYKLHKKIYSNEPNGNITAEDTHALLKTFKDFKKVRLYYFKGGIDFSKWKKSGKSIRTMLKIISRYPIYYNKDLSEQEFKAELNSKGIGKRINGIIVAKKAYEIKNFTRGHLNQILLERFPNYKKIIPRLSGDLDALFMSSWEKETRYLSNQFSPGRILDICCGVGLRSIIFAERHEVVAVDISRNRIASARKNAKLFNYSRRIYFINRTAFDLDLLKKLGEFSVIFVDTDWRENLRHPLKKHSINPLKTTPRTDLIYKSLRALFPNTPIVFKVSPFSRVEDMRKLGSCKIEEMYINNKFLSYNVYFSPKINVPNHAVKFL